MVAVRKRRNGKRTFEGRDSIARKEKLYKHRGEKDEI